MPKDAHPFPPTAQARGRLFSLVDLRSVLRGPVVRSTHQNTAVPVDHRQKIVEVMRDAARRTPDGLHFVRLVQLGFEPDLLPLVARKSAADRLLFIELVPAARGNQRPDRCPDNSQYDCTDSRILPTGGGQKTEAGAILVAR